MTAIEHVKAFVDKGTPIPDDEEGRFAKQIMRSIIRKGYAPDKIAQELGLREGEVIAIVRILEKADKRQQARPKVVVGQIGTTGWK